MDIVKIPTTVLLDEMMKKLDLPNPRYNTNSSGEANLVSSVTFNPTTRSVGSVYGTISLLGSPMDTLEEANADAAKQVIKYMAKNEKKILKDYNYDQLEEERMIKLYHIEQSIKNNREKSNVIKEKDHQIENITKQMDDFIEDVSTANNKIYLIAEEGYTNGESEEGRDMNRTLYEVQTGTEHVKHLTFVAMDVLQQIGKFPHDTDYGSSETAPFSGHYPSPPLSPPGHYIRSYLDDVIMYDSDGRSMCDSDDLSNMEHLYL